MTKVSSLHIKSKWFSWLDAGKVIEEITILSKLDWNDFGQTRKNLNTSVTAFVKDEADLVSRNVEIRKKTLIANKDDENAL